MNDPERKLGADPEIEGFEISSALGEMLKSLVARDLGDVRNADLHILDVAVVRGVHTPKALDQTKLKI